MQRGAVRPLLALSVAGACLVGALSGCGFVGASDVSHTKPSGFVLRGRVTVPVAGSGPEVDGATCTSAVSGVGVGVPVKVSDVDGHELADGELGDGVVEGGGSGAACDFPFEIQAVPGGFRRYAISVAGRPAQTFGATPLRQDQQAVVVLTS